MSRQDDLKKLITSHTRRLQKLKEQKALRGLNTSPEILIEIEDIEAEIEDLQAEPTEIEESVESNFQTKATTSSGVHPPAKPPSADVAVPLVSNVARLPERIVSRKELTTLRNLLLSREGRPAVIAMQGMGGVGKTTLAIALCHDEQVIEAFPNGILWATLGPQADVLSRQSTWGSMLGNDLTNLPDVEARAAQLRFRLQTKRCLLVIDDVWETADLEPMRVGGPQCATLVTTRIDKVAQEETKNPQVLDALDREEALKLLEEWAGEIADEEKDKAEELARRLGYLPLALALAGAQIQGGETWPGLLKDFRDVQGADLASLDKYNPTQPKESLTLTFDLSLKRLGDALAEQFAILGVFAAGREAPFTAEAAAAVWAVEPREARRKVLEPLVQTALVNREGNNYSLHLLLGDYAHSRLDEATRQAAEARHSAYYLEVAQRSEEEWQVAEAALPQMRIAWSRVAKDDADSLVSWAYTTRKFFNKRGNWADKMTWVEVARAAVQAAGQRRPEAWCEFALGEVYQSLDRLDEAIEQFWASLAIYREVGDRVSEAYSLNQIGYIHHRWGELDEALAQWQDSLTIFRQVKNRRGEAQSLHNIGHIHRQRGKLDEASASYQASLSIKREIGDRIGEAVTLWTIGRVYRQLGKLDEALAQWQGSLVVSREVGYRVGEAHSLAGIGRIHRQRGKLNEAFKQLQASLTIFREVRGRDGEAYAIIGIGNIYRQQGELDEALAQYQASLTIFREVSDRTGEAQSLNNIGHVHLLRGELDEALTQFQASLAIYREVDDRVGEAQSLNNIGVIHRQRSELDEAMAQFQASLTIMREAEDRAGQAESLKNIGSTCEQMDRLAETEESLAGALALFEAMGMPEAEEVRADLERVRGRLG